MGSVNNAAAGRLNRRRLFKGIAALIIATPIARIVWLWQKGKPLPKIAEPSLVLSGQWLLDESDLTRGAGDDS